MSDCKSLGDRGRKPGNLSRTLKTMPNYGLVEMKRATGMSVRSSRALSSVSLPDCIQGCYAQCPPWSGQSIAVLSGITNRYHAEAVMTVAAVRPVAIKIDEDTKARVKRLADARQRTPHWLMREAITQYVDREEKREAFRQDALQAWETFRVAGQHVTADEADA